MKKRKYSEPWLEVEKFKLNDLIMVSSEDANGGGDDTGGSSFWNTGNMGGE